MAIVTAFGALCVLLIVVGILNLVGYIRRQVLPFFVAATFAAASACGTLAIVTYLITRSEQLDNQVLLGTYKTPPVSEGYQIFGALVAFVLLTAFLVYLAGRLRTRTNRATAR